MNQSEIWADLFQPIRQLRSRIDNDEWRVLIGVALIIGGIWALACWLGAHRLRGRGGRAG